MVISTIICATLLVSKKTVVESIDINSVKSSERALFSKNIKHAMILEHQLIERGYGNKKCLLAIHANTWHESKWNPGAKSGSFVGMFQIGGSGTMGAGTTVEQRKDISFSVNLISSRTDFNNWYKRHKYGSTTTRQAATEFASRVLRCATRHVASRGSTVNRWER